MYEWTDPEDERWRNSSWYKVFIERTEFVLPFCENRYVLDSCCGCGWTTFRIAKVANKVIGIDICEEAIKIAEGKYSAQNITYLKMNALSMEFKEDTFDTVVSLESIEHFDKYSVDRYLSEIKRVLRRGGIFVGSTPRARTFIHEYLYLKRNKYHKKLYNKNSLKVLLSRYFKNVQVIEKSKNNYMLFYCERP